MTTSTPERLITIEGCYNLRDTGGYAARGGTTRWRTLLRSASPHLMPEASWGPLGALGLRTLIDLRRPSEAQREGYHTLVAPPMRYAPMPLFDDRERLVVDKPANNLGEFYRLALKHCGGQFRAVIQTIAEDPDPVLVHCAVGKDRTGMVIVLALGALGVAHETLAADYAMSNELLRPLEEPMRAKMRAQGADMERFERMMESRYEVMIDTLAHLDAEYGGFSGYMEQIGLAPATLEKLRQKLVE